MLVFISSVVGVRVLLLIATVSISRQLNLQKQLRLLHVLGLLGSTSSSFRTLNWLEE